MSGRKWRAMHARKMYPEQWEAKYGMKPGTDGGPCPIHGDDPCPAAPAKPDAALQQMEAA